VGDGALGSAVDSAAVQRVPYLLAFREDGEVVAHSVIGSELLSINGNLRSHGSETKLLSQFLESSASRIGGFLAYREGVLAIRFIRKPRCQL
jgi:hypothetical protein